MTTTTKKKPAPFILGKRPDAITATVPLPMPDGEIKPIECKFKYRTRTEFGQFWDAMSEPKPQAKALALDAGQEQSEQPATPAERATFTKALEDANRVNVTQTLDFLTGWNLDCELNAETLEQLFDQVPAAASALFEAYRAASVHGRLGN